MASATVEDYLKNLYSLQQQTKKQRVAMGTLARAMGVTPGTATAMVKALSDGGLVEYEPRGGVRLSPKGQKLALHVLRRHRLVELFLVEVLGFNWSEVDEEAEALEHAISDKVLARIDEHLGQPAFDPHGDPIPNADGEVRQRKLRSLADADPKRPLRIARVVDQDPQFLQFADRHGLMPGTELTVEARDPSADVVSVRPEGQPLVTIGTTAAEKIFVEQG